MRGAAKIVIHYQKLTNDKEKGIRDTSSLCQLKMATLTPFGAGGVEMAMRIWFSVFCGVLIGGSISYSLTGALFSWGALVGMLAGSVASFIVLSPEYFFTSFRSQLESIDAWYRECQAEKVRENDRIAQMRAAWIEAVPDILCVLRLKRLQEMRSNVVIWTLVGVLFLIPFYAFVHSYDSVPRLLFTKTLFLDIILVKIGWDVAGTVFSMPMAGLWSLRESVSLIPPYWKLPTNYSWGKLTERSFFVEQHENLIILAMSVSPKEYWIEFWKNWPKIVFFGWFTFVVWPAMKFVGRGVRVSWDLIPNALEAGWRVFRYMHTAGHRHVMLHTSLTLAVGIWGFNAPVIPLALIGATASAILWVLVSRRVFHAA